MDSFLMSAGIVFTVLYLIISLIIYTGLRRDEIWSSDKPFISILIPARNEAQNLPVCLDSMTALSYPANLSEVIILNDRSSDDTAEIAQNYCKKYGNFCLINISEDTPGLSGKMNVLNQGIAQAKGEILLVTDADCEVTPGWADALVSYFTRDTAMAGGITLLSKEERSESVSDRIQAIDWLFLQGVAAGATNCGIPISILGNNFAFRKSAYLETGGYSAIGFSLTEDMALLQAIRKLKKWKIKYALNSKTRVYSLPLNTFQELLNQRLRWVSGGMKGPISGWFFMAVAFLTHLVLPVILITEPLSLSGLSLLMTVFLADFFAILRPLTARLNITYLLKYFFLFELYYFFYTTFYALLALLPLKISWKNRKY
jgi:cellulose synthase/poly-beta-1,6-N-acetylglucosamine synthase-like glycosyltransferase